jgi:hypothetical protein
VSDHTPLTPPWAVPERPGEAAYAEVSAALWHIRELFDLLTFKLETEQVLVSAGRVRWLGRATHEVELVLEELRHAELRRAVELDAVAVPLGLPADCSLGELAEAVPAPWDEVFGDHRNALRDATNEITALAEANHELLDSNYRAVREALGLGAGLREGGACTAAVSIRSDRPRRLFDQSG